jgi:hypothetical protein
MPPLRYRVPDGVEALAYHVPQLSLPMLAWKAGSRFRVRWLPSQSETEREIPLSRLGMWHQGHERSWDEALARSVEKRAREKR